VRKTTFIILLVSIFLPAPALAGKILIVSDTQYGWFGLRGDRKERENFQKIIDLANSGRFEALIILGDMADAYPKTFWRRSRQVRALLDDVAKIKNTRVFFVAGNHDVGDNPTPETMEKFKKDFGFPTWYAFYFGGHKFLAIDTTLFKNRKRLPRLYDEQVKFIEKNRDAKFVLGHHPPFQKKSNRLGGYFSWPADAWRAVSSLFPAGTFFFSGHTHRPFERIIDGFRIINAGTCCAPWRNGIKSYGILELDGADIRYQEYILP
jgi:predicted phosphodiesterase